MSRRLGVVCLGIGIAATAALLAACDASPRDTAGSTLTVQYPGDERILGPAWDMPAKFLMFEPLVAIDEHGELEGRLATSWEHSPDYRQWTIRLRSDVLWHDGTRFTAHDVKFTHDLLAHPDVLRNKRGSMLTVIDDSTYTITFDGKAEDPLDTWAVVYPKHLLEALAPGAVASWDFWTRPVGTGPFRYVRHLPKTMMAFEANPDYYRGRPRIDRLVLRFGESSLPELLAGTVDALGWAGPMDVLKIRDDERFAPYYYAGTAMRAILWKATHPLFADARVRRALTHAIDRRELHRVLDLPEGLPILDMVVTGRQFRRGEFAPGLPHDSAAAARLLADAGWVDGDGDGVREKDGRAFRFELIAPAGEDEQAAVYVQNQLRRVGIAAEVRLMPLNLVRRTWRAGDFEAIVAIADQTRAPLFFGEESVLGYENARARALLRDLDEILDPEERDAVFRELGALFHQEQPATFLFPLVSHYVVHRRVRGLSSPWRADPLMNLDRLWIDDER